MHRLAGLWRPLRGDEGITMVLVGVMLAVVLGLAGMAVDLGVVYAERRELRTAADAAALAIAEDCARGTRSCDQATALNTATLYAHANAWDGSSVVESVDLNISGPRTGSVRVVTSAWDAASNQAGVPVPLMSLLGIDRVSVGAAATAIFDHPGSGGGVPLTIDTCEFAMATANGATMGVGSRTLLIFKELAPEPQEYCPAGNAGQDAPGSFGWLLTNGVDCWASATIQPPWPQADTGVSPSTGCDPIDLRGLVGQDLVIPVYYDICRDAAGEECSDEYVVGSADVVGGANTYYAIAGFASFHLEAFFFSQQYKYPSDFSCETHNSSDRCIQGYFTDDQLMTSGDGGGGDFGVSLVKLTE